MLCVINELTRPGRVSALAGFEDVIADTAQAALEADPIQPHAVAPGASVVGAKSNKDVLALSEDQF
jgi:hypothetical protein